MSLYLTFRETRTNPAEYASNNEVECAACHRMIDAQDEAYMLEDGTYLCVWDGEIGPKSHPCALVCPICEEAVHETTWIPGVERKYDIDAVETEAGWAHRRCLMEVQP